MLLCRASAKAVCVRLRFINATKVAQGVRHPAPVLDTGIFIGKSRDKIAAELSHLISRFPFDVVAQL